MDCGRSAVQGAMRARPQDLAQGSSRKNSANEMQNAMVIALVWEPGFRALAAAPWHFLGFCSGRGLSGATVVVTRHASLSIGSAHILYCAHRWGIGLRMCPPYTRVAKRHASLSF